MTTTTLLETIEALADDFDPIDLSAMDGVRLMNRTDTKFILPLVGLPEVLQELSPHYSVLTIDRRRLFSYQTLYYDTPDLQLYHAHRAGRCNRFKIRTRRYVDSELCFFEVKQKNNKGRTIKQRIPCGSLHPLPDAESRAFLAAVTPLDGLPLQGQLWIDYTRITFVGKAQGERLTIDLRLSFRNESAQVHFPEIVIAELKQNRAQASVFRVLMKRFGIRQGGISKYCFGITCLHEHVKQNRFKPHWQTIRKIIRQHEAFTAALSAYSLSR